MATYTTFTSLSIRFADTDMAGVVHHAKFIEYYEAGRIDFLSQHGLSYAKLQRSGIGLVPIKLNVQYIRPLKFGMDIVVKTTLDSLNKASMYFVAEIWCEDKCHSKMDVKLACMNEIDWQIISLPADLKNLFLN